MLDMAVVAMMFFRNGHQANVRAGIIECLREYAAMCGDQLHWWAAGAGDPPVRRNAAAMYPLYLRLNQVLKPIRAKDGDFKTVYSQASTKSITTSTTNARWNGWPGSTNVSIRADAHRNAIGCMTSDCPGQPN